MLKKLLRRLKKSKNQQVSPKNNIIKLEFLESRIVLGYSGPICDLAGDIGVDASSNVEIQFDLSLDSSTINDTNIFLESGLRGYLDAAVSLDVDTNTVTINPDSDFLAGEEIYVHVTSDAQYGNGNSVGNYQYSFTAETCRTTATASNYYSSYTGNSGCNNITDICTADFNGDGYVDVVQGTSDGELIYYFNNKNGSFTKVINNAVGRAIQSITAADVDYNGKMDLVLTVNNYNNILFCMADDASSTYPHSIIKEIPDTGSGNGNYVELRDFDGDGTVDCVTLDGNSLLITYNLMAENLSTSVISNLSSDHTYVDLYSYDYNSDGSLDLYVNATDGHLKTFQNRGLNDIIPSGGASRVGISDCFKVREINLTSDSDEDKIFATNDYLTMVFSDRSHNEQIDLDGLTCMEIADVNGDGNFDIITNRGILTKFSVSGSWGDTTLYYTAINDLYSSDYAAVADINNDGSMDIITCSSDGDLEVFSSFTAKTQTIDGSEDSNEIITLLTNSEDDNSNSFIITSLPANGSLYQVNADDTKGDKITAANTTLVNSDHKVIFVPDADEYGNDYGNFLFKSHNGSLYSNVAEIKVNISSVNDAPKIVSNAGLTLDEGATIIIPNTKLQITDVDNPVAELTYTLTSGPLRGKLQINGSDLAVNDTFTQMDINNNLLKYIHNGSEINGDIFKFTASDGVGGNMSELSFAMSVSPINDAPSVDTNAGLTLDEDATAVITNTKLKITDVDTSAGDITFILAAIPVNGKLQLDGSDLAATDTFSQADIDSGKLKYVHDGSETTADSFKFTANDSSGGNISETTFSITVTAVNDVPIGANSSISIMDNVNYGFAAEDFGFEDIEDGDTVSSIKITSINTAGIFKYDDIVVAVNTEISDFSKLVFYPEYGSGGDSWAKFSYQVGDSDGAYSTSSYEMSIDVELSNHAPICENQHITILEDTQAKITLSANDFENDSLVYKVFTLPANGDLYQCNDDGSIGNLITTANTVITNSSKAVIYIPDSDGFGSYYDSISFLTNDGVVDSVAGTISFDITGINDAPSFIGGTDLIHDEDRGNVTVTGWATDISAGPNEQSQSVVFELSTDNEDLFAVQPQIDSHGNLSYTIKDNYYGSAEVTVILKDDGGITNDAVDSSGEYVFTITVNSVNDSPVIEAPANMETDEDCPIALDNIYFSDVDSFQGEILVSMSAENGTFSLSSNVDVNFITGDGSNDHTMSFLASIDKANQLMSTLIYLPDNNYHGNDNINIAINDNGHSGSGGELIANASISIVVNDINDAPIVEVETDDPVADGGSVNLNVPVTDDDQEGCQLNFFVDQNNDGIDPDSDMSINAERDEVTGTYIVDTESAGLAYGFYDVYVVATDIYGESSLASSTKILVPNVLELSSKQPVSYLDANDNIITVKFSGKGIGQVLLPGEVDQGVDAYSVVIPEGTKAKLKMRSSEKDTPITVSKLDIAGDLKKLYAPGLIISDELIIDGDCKYVKVDSFSGLSITDKAEKVKVVANSLNDAVIDTAGRLDLRLNDIANSTINSGSIKKVTVKGDADNLSIISSNDIGNLKIYGNSELSIDTDGSIKNLIVKGDANVNISSAAIYKVLVADTLTGTISIDSDSSEYSIKKISSDIIDSLQLNTNVAVKQIKANNIINSDFSVNGVDTLDVSGSIVDSELELSTDIDGLVRNISIGSIQTGFRFSNSSISANTIESLSLRSTERFDLTDNSQITADKVDYYLRSTGGDKIVLRYLDAPAQADSIGSYNLTIS